MNFFFFFKCIIWTESYVKIFINEHIIRNCVVILFYYFIKLK